jgi:TRAP-type mannitol/chloroaromatic compound transport system permease small subunit
VNALYRLSDRMDALSDRLGKFVGWLTLAMIILGAFNAVARYTGKFTGVNLSSNAYIEMQWYLFSLIFLLGAAHTLQRDQHVRVDVLYERLSKRAQARVDLAGGFLFLIPFSVFGLVMCWPTVRNSWSVWEGSPDPGGLPRYPLKSAMLLCFGLLLLQGLSEMVKRIRILREDPE